MPQARDLPVRKLNRRWAEVRLPTVDWCRFRRCRPLGGEIHATVSREALGWHVSFCVALIQKPARPNGRPPVGADRGLAATVALSTGELRCYPTLPTGQQDGCGGCAGGRAGRRPLGGADETVRAKARPAISARGDAIARLRAREAGIRSGFPHGVSTDLAESHGLGCDRGFAGQEHDPVGQGTLAEPGSVCCRST